MLNLVVPLTGFLICFYLWCHLARPAKLAGLAWLSTGFLYGAWKTKGFRQRIEFAAPVEAEEDLAEPSNNDAVPRDP